MSTENTSWKLQTLDFTSELNEALLQQHHAAQFIALAGHYLILQQPDDSNTNMHFIVDEELLVGNSLSGDLYIALHLPTLKLSILNGANTCLKEIILEGNTRNKVFDELKAGLENLGIDVSALRNELHYELPSHPLDQGDAFSITESSFFLENSLYRHNAQIIISTLAARFEQSAPVRIWPHHFDTGTFVPLAYNEKGDLAQSIGMGWAMPDSMVSEPYYYLSYWSEETDLNFKELPKPDAGQWILTGWKGGVLNHSDILKCNTAEEQHKQVSTFFNSGIEIITNHIKSAPAS